MRRGARIAALGLTALVASPAWADTWVLWCRTQTFEASGPCLFGCTEPFQPINDFPTKAQCAARVDKWTGDILRDNRAARPGPAARSSSPRTQRAKAAHDSNVGPAARRRDKEDHTPWAPSTDRN